MKRFFILILIFLVLLINNIALGFNVDWKTIELTRTISASVAEFGQTRAVQVPSEPLSFDSQLSWDVTITKKSLLSERKAAYFAIEEKGADGKNFVRRVFTAKGYLIIPKGASYKVVLDAGEYTNPFTKSGAEVNAKLQYKEVQIRYAQGDKPFLFQFDVLGPVAAQDWTWNWSGKLNSTGNAVSVQFEKEGKYPVVLETKGSDRKYYFDLDVPALLVMNPKLDSLKGPVEMRVKAQADSVVNYGQQAKFQWDFGNGTTLTGTDVSCLYTKPGKYLVKLSATVDRYTYQRIWMVEADPLTIIPNPVVTPTTGPVPLDVTGKVTPNLSGGPTNLVYRWLIGKETVEGTSFTHRFTEPGNYRVVLQTVDQIHPELIIPDEVIMIKVLAPALAINPKASLTNGLIPFTVAFESGLEVKGSPSELAVFWDFGDGESSNQLKPVHIYKEPGEYDVKLSIVDQLHPGNLAWETLKITATPPELRPTATASAVKGFMPHNVNFTAQVGITGSPCDPLFIWDFGDGETSYEQNPAHVYRQAGSYPVKLSVRDRLHPQTIAEANLQIEVVTPKLRLTSSVTPTTGPAPLTIQCRAWGEKEGTPNPALKYVWDFGDGSRAEGTETQHSYQRKGTYTVTITLQDPALGLKEVKTYKIVVK